MVRSRFVDYHNLPHSTRLIVSANQPRMPKPRHARRSQLICQGCPQLPNEGHLRMVRYGQREMAGAIEEAVYGHLKGMLRRRGVT